MNAVTLGRVVAALLFACAAAASAQPAPAPDPAAAPRRLQVANKPWKGDFDQMLERRMIRIYAPFSRSLYFSDKGRECGIAVELARDGMEPKAK